MAPWVEDWNHCLDAVPLSDAQLGPRVKLQQDLEARAYLCPSWGTLHSVYFGRQGHLPLYDVSPADGAL